MDFLMRPSELLTPVTSSHIAWLKAFQPAVPVCMVDVVWQVLFSGNWCVGVSKYIYLENCFLTQELVIFME